MEKRATALRWGVEQRLEFIEFRLFWEGGLNRSDITTFFGVSVPQASKDLSQYQELAPQNIRYDRSQKRYFAADKFSPLFMKPDADRYLAQLRSLAERTVSKEDGWLSQPPPAETVPLPHRHVDPATTRAVIDAIRERCALEVRYQSLSANRPNAMWRWISPHAFGFDGNRWHIRAFCHIDHSFKDFLLPRILNTRGTAEAGAFAQDDWAWNEITSVILKPHSGLTDDQKRVVAQDFGMKGERLEMKIRLALLYYLLRRLELHDIAGEKRAAREQHVVLADPDTVRAALKRAQTGSAASEHSSLVPRAV